MSKHTPGPWNAGSRAVVADDSTLICLLSGYKDAGVSRANAQLIAAAPELLEALRTLIGEVDGLVGESHGVAGLHLNGDVALWDELTPGGRFERLSSLDDARALVAKAGAKP